MALKYTLLDGVTGTTAGEWQDVRLWSRLSIHLTFGVGTAQIFGSCKPEKPADATDDVQIGANITSDTIYEVTAKINWIKVKVSAYTSGAISAYAVGDSIYDMG